MVAITSHRPMRDSAEVAENQLRAFASWLEVFDEIVYFGNYEKSLDSDKTTFVECEPFPHISELAMAASFADDFVCLINADIIVSPNLADILTKVEKHNGIGATSRRWCFHPPILKNAYLTDYGIDFFWTIPRLWRMISKDIPSHYRIGHNCWDTWVMSFLNTIIPRNFYNLTNQRCIFHPFHKDRKRAYDVAPIDDKYTRHCGFPNKSL